MKTPGDVASRRKQIAHAESNKEQLDRSLHSKEIPETPPAT